ncbi:MAG: acyl-CoA dehydrogenase family protein [Halobacteriales archaeon]
MTPPNYFSTDQPFRREIRRLYDTDDLDWAEPRLERFGRLVAETVADNSDVVDRNGPVLHTFDADGALANEVAFHPAHLENERLVFESGIVADSFVAPPGRDDPLPISHNLAMQYLLSYADVGLDCPVAMSAGVALVLERFADTEAGPLAQYYDGLTARSYDDLMQGAMFLTERQGGSDVGATETVARRDPSTGRWHLEGEKWFCSNLHAEATLALARPEGSPPGTEGLAMFLVPHTREDGTLNDQRYRRLKDKLGTVSVPTGEVELEGAEAYLVGEADRGFKQMAEMLNLERLSNAVGACGLMGRARLESVRHAAEREAFGRHLDRHPLMRVDLVDMTVDHEAATAFTFEAVRHFADRETARRTGADPGASYPLMRGLVPIAKARTGRMAVETASYAMEILGGNGYVADFVTHRLLRDAQVLPIWEGTENVLSLDLLRAFATTDAQGAILSAVDDHLDGVEAAELESDLATVEAARDDLAEAIASLATADRDHAERVAKRLLHLVFDVVTAAVLLAEAQTRLASADDARLALVARRFVDRELRHDAARGVPDGDPLVAEHAEAIIRYAAVDRFAVDAG